MVRTSLPLPLPLSVGECRLGLSTRAAGVLTSLRRCGPRFAAATKGRGPLVFIAVGGATGGSVSGKRVPSVGTDGKHPMGEGAVRLGLIRSPAMTARETAFGFPLVSFGVWLYLRTPFSGSPAPASHGLSVVLTEETRRVCARACDTRAHRLRPHAMRART